MAQSLVVCRTPLFTEASIDSLSSLADININTLEPSQVLKIGLTETHARSGPAKRARSRSIVPVLENSIIMSHDFKIIQR